MKIGTAVSERPRSKIRQIKKQFNGWLILLPAIVCVYFFIIRPQIMGIAWSFCDMRGYRIEGFNGLENYRVILSNSDFLPILWNTCLYVIWSLVVGFVVPIIVAMVLNELVHMRNFFRFWVYFPSVLPGVAVMLMWYMVFYPDSSGLLNMVLGRFGLQAYEWLQDSRFTILYIVVSMTWNSAGATALYYFASLQGVSRELYEAAVIDGAGFFKRFWTVTFPHMSGILLLFLVKQIMGVFSIVDQPMQMTGGGPGNASMTLGYWAYKYAFEYNKPQFSMAIGVIMFLILMVFTSFYFVLDKRVQSNY